MNILYLTMAEIDEASGVYKKICSQVASFHRMAHECDLLFIQDSGTAILRKLIGDIRLPGENETIEDAINAIVARHEVCYARFELLRHKYYKYALDCCKRNGVDLIVEIPTYPPYQESLARVKEKIARHNYTGALKTLIGTGVVIYDQNRIVRRSKMMCLVADDKKFLLKKTIRIENGIDLERNPFIVAENDEPVRIIAVSNFAIWNGYDRAIRGLKDYKEKTSTRDIKLVFVGDKKKASDLIGLAEKLGLQDYVEFTGALSGKELDDEYAKANIGLGALGNHRRKVFANSSLKAKEYAARGLIMILADSEGIEQDIKDRSFVIASDETSVDFIDFMNWYRKNATLSNRKYIRSFAEDHYSWNAQMEKVINAYYSIKK